MKKIRKQTAGFSVALVTFVAAAGVAQADGTSDGSTAASGDTLVTMTVPKFAEVQGATDSVGFTVTSAEYAADTAIKTGLIGFKVRTNSIAGLTVQVKGATSPTLRNEDIVLTSDGGFSDIQLLGTVQNIWANTENINELPVENNVNIGVTVNDLHGYTSNGPTKTYTNTLTFTVLPN